MLRKTDNNVQWLEFEIFQAIPHLIHGIFLRHGGASKGAFSSLNVGESCGDSLAAVQLNRKKIARLLGIGRLISGNQVHGTEIAIDQPQSSCDGLITKEQNLGLLIKHADCQAALIVDPINKVIANVHAGWRGNIQNIYGLAVQKLQKEFGSIAANLLVGISPSLGPSHAEFLNYESEFPQQFWEYKIKEFHFDLWRLAEAQFKAAGVLSHHIEIAQICTYAGVEDYFSYRREKRTGRHGAIIAWKK